MAVLPDSPTGENGAIQSRQFNDLRVAALCGGVGAARFLQGAQKVCDPSKITAITNVGDDCVAHGLHISPDLDTILYTLAGRHDDVRGWGQRDETWNTLGALGELGQPTWFQLGDRDIATHLFRTDRLRGGDTLTFVSRELCRRFRVKVDLIPATNDRIETFVTIADAGEVSFQEYFVQLRHGVPITKVRFQGASVAKLSNDAVNAVMDADVIVLCPSNPILSLDPLFAIGECTELSMRELVRSRRDRVVAISPLVGGRAIKGPAERIMRELGLRPDALGIATYYRDLISMMVIDDADAQLADEIESLGIRCVVTDTMMTSIEASTALAEFTFDQTTTIARAL